MRRTMRRSAPSNWRRGFDWDGWLSGPIELNPGDFYAQWLRFPSDGVDPTQPTIGAIGAKTLVNTRLFFTFTINPSDVAGEANRLMMGVITFDWADPTTMPNFAQAPDPFVGSYDWIIWNPTGSTAGFVGEFFTLTTSAQDDGCLQSKAMRKLPPGRGVLFVMAYEGVQIVRGFASARLGLKGDVTAVGLGSG